MAALLYPSSTAGASQSQMVRSALLPPLLRYVCVGRKGATLRAGSALDSAVVGEVKKGAAVDVEDAADAGNTRRLRVVAPASGWVSAKLFAYDGQSGHANPFRDASVAAPKKPKKKPKESGELFPAPTGTGHVLLFPGQGAQKVGMLAPYRDAPGVSELFATASAIYGIDLLKLVEEGPAETLNDTRYAQACVFLTSMAAVLKLKKDDPKALAKADVTAGFSLGEYSALVFAGVMDVDTCLRLLKVRSEAMGAACDLAPSGMMTVIGVDDAVLGAMLPDTVTVANQLFPKGRVLSGAKDGLEAVKAAVDALKLPGTKTIVQPVSGAFHSPYLAGVDVDVNMNQKISDLERFSLKLRDIV